MRLLCPPDTVCDDTMNLRVLVDRKGFVSGSKEEDAAPATLERAAAAEYLATFKPRHENQFVGNGNVKRFAIHFRLWNFKVSG